MQLDLISSGNSEGRLCTECDAWKPWSKFAPHQTNLDRHCHQCRDCVNAKARAKRAYDKIHHPERHLRRLEQNREWRKNNAERFRALCTSGRLRLTYGISTADYDEMHESQGGVCAICGRTDQRRLSVDHDHVTGAIRGLLCTACNRGIATFGDNLDGALRVVEYLSRDPYYVPDVPPAPAPQGRQPWRKSNGTWRRRD